MTGCSIAPGITRSRLEYYHRANPVIDDNNRKSLIEVEVR